MGLGEYILHIGRIWIWEATVWIVMCWTVSPKRIFRILTPGPKSVTFFGIRVSKRCNQVRMRALWWALIKYDWHPCKKKKIPSKDKDTQGEYFVTREAEIRMRQMQAKIHQGLMATARSYKAAKKILPVFRESLLHSCGPAISLHYHGHILCLYFQLDTLSSESHVVLSLGLLFLLGTVSSSCFHKFLRHWMFESILILSLHLTASLALHKMLS